MARKADYPTQILQGKRRKRMMAQQRWMERQVRPLVKNWRWLGAAKNNDLQWLICTEIILKEERLDSDTIKQYLWCIAKEDA